MRHELQTKRDAALRAHERKKTFSENTVLLLGGVAEGLAAPFVEMVREIVDLTQGALLWVSGARYHPEFTGFVIDAALRARYSTPRFDFTVPATVEGLRSISKVLPGTRIDVTPSSRRPRNVRRF